MNLTGATLAVRLPDEPFCAVLKFRDGLVYGQQIPQMPAVLVQCTVRMDKVSPSGALIRFGDTPGDELIGWMRRDYLEVVEVLGTAKLGEKSVTITPLAEAA